MTKQGLLALQQEVRRLEELVENGKHILSVHSVEFEIVEKAMSLQMT